MHYLNFMLLIACFTPMSNEGNAPTFYPRILSRGLPKGKISFYEKLVDFTVLEQVTIPDVLKNSRWQNWTHGSMMAQKLAKYFNNGFKYLPPPFDHLLEMAPGRTSEPFGDTENDRLLQQQEPPKPTVKPVTTTSKPVVTTALVHNGTVDNSRPKRDLSLLCSNVISHAVWRLFKSEPCVTGQSEEVKTSLKIVMKELEVDRHAMETEQKEFETIKGTNQILRDELESTRQAVRTLDHLLFEEEQSLIPLKRTVFLSLLHLASEIAFTERLRSFANLLSLAGSRNLARDEVPWDVGKVVSDRFDGTLVAEMLTMGSQLLLKPEIHVVPFVPTRILISIHVRVPEVLYNCDKYTLDRLALQTSDTCLSGQEFRDLIIVDCGPTVGKWVASKSCLEECDSTGIDAVTCHSHHCGNDQKYSPEWLSDPTMGKLHADSESMPFCQRQPTLVRVGKNQYYLTRAANVSRGEAEVEVGMAAGTLIKTSCRPRDAFVVNGRSYAGTCGDGDDAIDGRISITNHDNLTMVDWDGIDMALQGNVSLEKELEGLIYELGNRSFIDKLDAQGERMTVLGHFVDTDMIKMVKSQRELATHVKLIKENTLESGLFDRILVIVIGGISFFSLLMSIITICIVRPTGGVGGLPIRLMNFGIWRRKPVESDEEFAKQEATAPMLPTYMECQRTDMVDYRGSTAGRDLDQALSMREFDVTMKLRDKPQMDNYTTREIAEYVLNVMRRNGIYFQNDQAWGAIGQDKPIE